MEAGGIFSESASDPASGTPALPDGSHFLRIPDLSYHGESAWRPCLEGYNRYVGIMLCGKYAKTESGKDDDFIYIAMNMHWESHRLALPKLPKGMCWRMAFATAGVENIPEPAGEGNPDSSVTVEPRSIAVLVSVEGIGNKKGGRK